MMLITDLWIKIAARPSHVSACQFVAHLFETLLPLSV